jgi:2-(1,2-epoxy-1,2-dihydrophenyl)acetyl-CoA isomerase
MDVRMEVAGAVATVTLDRPAKKNAISLGMREALVGLFAEIEADDRIRAVVLTGAGGDFSAGADIGEMGGGGVAGSIARIRSVHRMVAAVALLDKPVVAAVNGICAGVAWSIALASDFIIAGETARFRFAFRQLGLAPDGAAPLLLVQSVGLQQAKELIYSGRFVDGFEAARLGLVLRTVPDTLVEAEARGLADELAAGPTLALTRAKRMFRAAGTQSFEQALSAEADAQPMIAQSEDYAEGRAAFADRRPPQFKGR